MLHVFWSIAEVRWVPGKRERGVYIFAGGGNGERARRLLRRLRRAVGGDGVRVEASLGEELREMVAAGSKTVGLGVVGDSSGHVGVDKSSGTPNDSAVTVSWERSRLC